MSPRFGLLLITALIALTSSRGTAVTITEPQFTMLVSDNRHDQILRYDATTGVPLGVLSDSGAGLDVPGGMLVHPTRNTLLVTNFGTNEVLELDLATGERLGVFAAEGMLKPIDLRVHPTRNTLLVSSRDTPGILEYELATGRFLGTFATADILSSAFVFDFDLSRGAMYLANYEALAGSIEEFDLHTGAHVRTLTNALVAPTGVFVHPHTGEVYADTNHFIKRFDAETGAELAPIGTGVGLDFPSRVGWSEPLGDILVHSRGSSQSIHRFDGQTGAYEGVFIPAGSGGLGGPASFLVYPVPEPTTVVLALGGLMVSVFRRSRRSCDLVG